MVLKGNGIKTQWKKDNVILLLKHVCVVLIIKPVNKITNKKKKKITLQRQHNQMHTNYSRSEEFQLHVT